MTAANEMWARKTRSVGFYLLTTPIIKSVCLANKLHSIGANGVDCTLHGVPTKLPRLLKTPALMANVDPKSGASKAMKKQA